VEGYRLENFFLNIKVEIIAFRYIWRAENIPFSSFFLFFRKLIRYSVSFVQIPHADTGRSFSESPQNSVFIALSPRVAPLRSTTLARVFKNSNYKVCIFMLC